MAGWIRGLRKRSTGNPKIGTGQLANGRWDICPDHAPIERFEAEHRKHAADLRRIRRDKNRKALDAKLEPVKK